MDYGLNIKAQRDKDEFSTNINSAFQEIRDDFDVEINIGILDHFHMAQDGRIRVALPVSEISIELKYKNPSINEGLHFDEWKPLLDRNIDSRDYQSKLLTSIRRAISKIVSEGYKVEIGIKTKSQGILDILTINLDIY